MTDLVHAFCVQNEIPAVSDLDAMIEAYQAGETWDSIREKFHHGREQCQRRLQEAGVYVPGQPTPYERNKAAKRAAKRAEVKRLYNETDMTLRAIREVLGLGSMVMYDMIVELGLDNQPRRGRRSITYSGPRCQRCGIPTNDGEQISKAAKALGICDYCLDEIKKENEDDQEHLYEIGELDNETLLAAMDAVIEPDEILAVAKRREELAMEFEVTQGVTQ